MRIGQKCGFFIDGHFLNVSCFFFLRPYKEFFFHPRLLGSKFFFDAPFCKHEFFIVNIINLGEKMVHWILTTDLRGNERFFERELALLVALLEESI